MRILFLCTANNSLSQRLYLDLTAAGHNISIEYALSDAHMLEAVTLFEPELIICPFLTAKVPKGVYAKVLTLIIHPGPPGDAGPSSLDWLILGDDGSVNDAERLLMGLSNDPIAPGRSHWGVTALQAIENFDEGPVWAFEQFPVNIDQAGLTKSELYRGSVTRAAVTAAKTAIERVQQAAEVTGNSSDASITPDLAADAKFSKLSVTDNLPFQGGKTHHRPLLKAAQRDFDVIKHTAFQISRRIRCGDSQPGALSRVFGPSLYVYGGIIEEGTFHGGVLSLPGTTTNIRGIRNDEAVCIGTADGQGVWIVHVRRPKGKDDPALWPKVPAVMCLVELGILATEDTKDLWVFNGPNYTLSPVGTFQDIWIDFQTDANSNKIGYLYFDFYNGAMSTLQCHRLIKAMDHILSDSSTESQPIRALVLMGSSSYFSNGINLNVIEASTDPTQESWLNINAIDDIVHYLLHEFPSRNILTVAAIRGNAAAGGVALAAACDIVIAGAEVVLNPAYRAIGLTGSEFHTLSYPGRCGEAKAKEVLRSMTPMSPLEAQRIGLVDCIFPGRGAELEDYIRSHVSMLIQPDGSFVRGPWKKNVDLSAASLSRTRALELDEMARDFWSPRSSRYHTRRFNFVRKAKATQTPLRFAKHRRGDGEKDFEETDDFDDIGVYRKKQEDELLVRLGDEMATAAKLAADSARMRLVLVADEEMKKHAEPVFPCYYKPVEMQEVTPPKTPSDGPSRAASGIFQLTEGGREAGKEV